MSDMDPATLRAVADWLDGRWTTVNAAELRTIADGLEAHLAKQEPPTCPGCGGPAVTHYAVIHFSGDPAGEHPDPELNGHGPMMMLIAQGDEEFCWQELTEWTAQRPLRMWETAEVLARTMIGSEAQP